MRAEATNFFDVLGKPGSQFVVPIFQRVYSWKQRDCEELFNDVLAAGKAGRSHFIGTFLYSIVDYGEDVVTYQIIDGQQRATTITLMLVALAERLSKVDSWEQKDSGLPTVEQLRERFLTCEGGKEPKLLLTSIDGDMLSYLLDLRDMPQDISARLEENLGVFRAKMGGAGFDLAAFWKGCEGLRVIAIELDQHDSPQEVFESLNARGRRLSVEDLVRNAILSSMDDPSEARELYYQHWLPLEEMVEEASDVEMDDVLCSWIASNHTNVYIGSKSEVYPLFKTDLKGRFKGDCKRLIASIMPYASRFTGDKQWRRDRLYELDKWLQGKPRNLISDRKLFGD